MKKLMVIAIAVLAFFGTAAQASEVIRTHPVVKGETMTTIGKKYGLSVQMLCKANPDVMHRAKGCDDIRAGERIKLPSNNVEATKSVSKPKVAASVVSKVVHKSSPVKAQENHTFYWNKLGGAAMCKANDKTMIHAQGWIKLGLTTEEVAELKAKRDAGMPDFTRKLKRGDRLVSMSYLAKDGHTVVVMNNVVVNFPDDIEADVKGYRLTRGGRLVEYGDVAQCCNEGILSIAALPPEAPAVPTVAEPEVPTAGTPEVTPPAIIGGEEPTGPPEEEKAAAVEYEHQVDAYIGYGKVWHDASQYGYVGFDRYLKQWVFVDKDYNKNSFGFGADYSLGDGKAGAGTFEWDAMTLRPVAYKIEFEGGKEVLRWRAVLMRINDSAEAGLYRNRREIFYWGEEQIFTNAARKGEGKKWFSEYRLSSSMLFAFRKSGDQSWMGRQITDTEELLKVKGMIRAGARLYVYDFDKVRTFVQAGLSVQWPDVARSVGFSAGVEDQDELWTVFVGPTFDIKNHTHSYGAEVSLQIGKAYLMHRRIAAWLGIELAVECTEGGGYAYFPDKGLMVKGSCPKDSSPETVTPLVTPTTTPIVPSG